MIFGKEIKKRRNDLNLTQKNLATSAGIKRPYLAQIENQGFLPSKEVAEKISSSLNYPALLQIFIEEKEQQRSYSKDSTSINEAVTRGLKALNRDSKSNRDSWSNKEEAVKIGTIVLNCAFGLNENFDYRQAAMEIIHLTNDYDNNSIFLLPIENMLKKLRDKNKILNDESMKVFEDIISKLNKKAP